LSLAEALARLRAGQPQAAAELLKQQLELQPTDARSWFLLGVCQHTLNDLPTAARTFARSLALDPSNPEANLAHVSVLRAMADAQGALAASKAALARTPNDPRFLYALALSHEDLGRTDDALAHYDAVLQIAPHHEDALHNRGLLLARLGRHDEAETSERMPAGSPMIALSTCEP